MSLQSTVLDVAEELLKYSVSMQDRPSSCSSVEDAIFIRIQAERLVNAIEKARGDK
jgi:hypothetical protein